MLSGSHTGQLMHTDNKRETAFLGLGSNMGDRKSNIERAVSLIGAEQNMDVEKVASVIETEAVGGGEQCDFLNTVMQVAAGVSPYELLDMVRSVEKQVGRTPSREWGPRTIDIDILFYNSTVIVSGDLVIPHPLACERIFTLKPMAEIAPALLHPVFNRTIEELYRERRDVLNLFRSHEWAVR